MRSERETEPEGRAALLLIVQYVVLAGGGIAGAILAAYWGVVGYHVARTAVLIPTARDGLAHAREHGQKPWGRVCVIVPAHNEEACIGLLARSLVGQDHPNLRVVFALDRCTDKTGEVVRAAVGDDDRVEIIEIASCPPDWAGKVHAIWRGVRDSKAAHEAELYLFVDADTVLEPSCIRGAAALMEHRGLGMLSLLSTMSNDRWFERAVQPAAGTELIRQYPIVRANAEAHRRPFANGQFILIKREVYDLIGGHEAVRTALLEDVEIARHVHWRGVRAGLFLADRMLHCRMYGSWKEFKRGWKRIYIDSAHRRPARLRVQAARVRWLGVYLPALSVLGIAGGLAWREMALAPIAIIGAGLGLVTWLLTVAACCRMANTPVWCAVLYPIGAWHVGAIQREAARDLERGGKLTWGGREYVLAKR